MENIGRYQILEQIGSGAMGSVYKARDPIMDRDVAIKTILTHVLEGPQAAEFRDRFFREARAAGRLAHPGIVTVYDVSENEGTPFLVMEYVAGRTLQSILESGERMALERACDLSVQLAEALGYAHQNGVIHRDIKPANILITPDGRVKIADFGVARLADAQVTSTAYLLGTPAFMAPEQFTGAPIDGRVDLFAAGVVIYWIMTGDKPFTGDSMLSVQYKVVHTDPVPPRKLNPALPKDFETIILRSLAKDPAERYQSGEQLAGDLRSVRSGQTILVRTPAGASNDAPTLILKQKTLDAIKSPAPPSLGAPTTVVLEPAKPQRRNRWLVAAVLVVVFLAGAAVARFRMGRRQQLAVETAAAQTGVAASRGEQQPAAAPVIPPPPPPEPIRPKTADRITEPTKNVPPKASTSKGRAEKSQPSKSEGIVLELTAQGRTNVVFESEGHPTEALNMKPGDSTTLRADQQASLTLNNPGALQLKLNGREISLGERRAGRFTVTPEGIEPYRGHPGNIPIPGLPKGSIPDFSGIGESIAGRINANMLGTPARQKELAQSATSVRLVIKSSAIPEFLTLVVRVDNAILFRREATAPIPEGLNQIPRKYPTDGIATVPLTEERLIPPGSHQLQVSLLQGNARFGQAQDLTAEFSAGQRQNLSIELIRENQAGSVRGGGLPRLRVTLE
jgi:serine/threonine-protein kinase